MTTPYIDPNLIFAENAPVQDKPAAFSNYDKGWDASRTNDGRPIIPQMNYLTQQADLKNLYIHENGAALPYKDGIAYEKNAVVVKDDVLQQWKGGEWVLVNSDSQIQTWSGRTQEQHNKENPSPFDFGAAGDGVTDDTQAFIDLESRYQSKIIDLQGNTYLVDSAPNKNTYINGEFKTKNTVGRKTNGDKKTLNRPQTPALNARVDTLDSNASPFIKLRQTVFFRNTVQSTAIDEVNRHIYTVQDANSGYRVIVQHTLDGGEFSTTLKGMKGTTLLSHSGIGIENADDGVYLWGCGIKNNSDPDYGNAVKAYRFKPVLDNFDISIYSTLDNTFQKTEYVLFDTPSKYENMNIAISYDQKWLIAMNRNLISGHFVFRFWDLKTLVNGGSGDYREKYSHEIVAKSGASEGGINFQGMSSYGDFLYVIGGGYYADQEANPDDPKCQLFVFDLQGNLVQHKYNLDVAMQAMIEAAGVNDTKVREVEAINFMKINGSVSPVITIAGSRNTTEGQSATRQQWLVALGYGSPIKNVSLRKNNPSFISVTDDSSLDYAGSLNYASGGSLKLGVVDRASQQWEILRLKREGSTINRDGAGTVLSYAMSGVVKGGTYVGDFNVTTTLKTGVNYNITTEGGDLWRFMNNGELRPGGNATHSIGRGGTVVNNIYLQNSPIVSSDERLKQQFRSLDEREKAAALEIKNSICMFKFNDAVNLKGDGARWHVGVKAQQVIAILESHDLNPFAYGFICFDEWGATDEHEAGSRYAIRYDELSMFILSAI